MKPGAVLLALVLLALPAQGAERAVPEDLTWLHLGPGSAYPAFHALRAGERVRLLRRRGGWIKVRAPGPVEGWLPETRLGPPPARPWAARLGGGRLGRDPWMQVRLDYLPGAWGVGLAWGEGAGTYHSHRLVDADLALRLAWRRWDLLARGGAGWWWRRPRPELVGAPETSAASVHTALALGLALGHLRLVAELAAYAPDGGPDTPAWTVGLEGRL